MTEPVSGFFRWLRRLFQAQRTYTVEHCEDQPDVLRDEVLYLVGDRRHPWSAAFACPCGCGETIALSLIREDSPSWRVRRHRNGTVSLFPSVWRLKGCRSHFFLRDSRIVWARSTNRLRESLR